MRTTLTLFTALALSNLPVSAAPPVSAEPRDAQARADASPAPEAKPTPEAKVWTTKHEIRIGSGVLACTATAGTMLIRDDKDEAVDLFGFTAYVKDGGDPRTRPIMFAYNGGPGSASAWLHMGILGPRRTVLDDLGANNTLRR